MPLPLPDPVFEDDDEDDEDDESEPELDPAGDDGKDHRDVLVAAGAAVPAASGFKPIDADRYVMSGFSDAARSYTEDVSGEPFGTRYPCRRSSLSRYGVSCDEKPFGTST